MFDDMLSLCYKGIIRDECPLTSIDIKVVFLLYHGVMKMTQYQLKFACEIFIELLTVPVYHAPAICVIYTSLTYDIH